MIICILPSDSPSVDLSIGEGTIDGKLRHNGKPIGNHHRSFE